MNYEIFIKQCKEKGASKPYMSEKQFNDAFGIDTEEIIVPLQIRPKNKKPIAATLANHKKVEV